MTDYVPLVVIMAAAVAIAAGMMVLKMALGPRVHSAEKMDPFECGNPQLGSPRRRFNVKFYGVALLFIIFDIETVFLFPWSALYKQLGVLGFVEMFVFVVILTAGLVYVWARGMLDWNGSPQGIEALADSESDADASALASASAAARAAH